MMKYRLGIDVGTNSLGWSVLELNEKKEPIRIEAAGVRIFQDGRNPKNNTTLKADRREARSARRRRDRLVQRKKYLVVELIKNGLFPEDIHERKSLQLLNPIELRALALNQKLPLYHLGRALFHLNQHRGFKSNRKDRSQDSQGVVSNSYRALLEEMDLIGPKISDKEYQGLNKNERKVARENEAIARSDALNKLKSNKSLTYGSFLWDRQQQGLPTRVRPVVDSKLYEIYPMRDLYIDEFEKIWDAQRKFYPDKLSDELRSHFKNIIYYQRPPKPQRKGKCMFYPDEDRTFRAMPSFQKYRILQDVNNLEWGTIHGVERLRENWTNRNFVLHLLQFPTKKTKIARVKFDTIRREFIKRGVMEDYSRFNLESENRKFLDCNQTTKVMQHEDYVGSEWHKWSLEKQDSFISIIMNEGLDDDKVCHQLTNEFNISEFSARNCVNASLVEGTANISLKAARLLSEIMEKNMITLYGAVIEAAKSDTNFNNPYIRSRDRNLLPKLPYYGKVVQGHIIPGTGKETDHEQDRIGKISNPTVHIALNQIRYVVNELIDRFGHPSSIAIELARELPAGKERRKEIKKKIESNQKRNEKYNKTLSEYEQKLNRNNRTRLRLWEDQNYKCVFTGDIIGLSELFTSDIEVEHLMPFSQSLDDSLANKVICKQQANRDKGNKTPYEAFGDSPKEYIWTDIFARVLDLPEEKQWRFREDAREIWERNGDFVERHLNDTRYIGRLAREYLENICDFRKIDVVTGRLTSKFRYHWGLNTVLNELRNPAYAIPDTTKLKNREDHRHHAIDAIVIGMTNRSLIQKISTHFASEDDSNESKIFDLNKPWSNFRRDVRSVVDKVVVSHAVRKRRLRKGDTDGQLHRKTAYGLKSNELNKNGIPLVVSRKPIDHFDSEKRISEIRGSKIRAILLKTFESNGKEGVIKFARKRGIRRLRRQQHLNVISIKDRKGNVYKSVKGDSNWGIEIYEYPDSHPKAGKWHGEVISRFDANQSGFQPGCTFRPHPIAKLVMRLQINECVEFKVDAKRRIMRVQKIGRAGQITFAEANEANVDSRMRSKTFKYTNKTANSLNLLNAKKVNISPTGIVRY